MKIQNITTSLITKNLGVYKKNNFNFEGSMKKNNLEFMGDIFQKSKTGEAIIKLYNVNIGNAKIEELNLSSKKLNINNSIDEELFNAVCDLRDETIRAIQNDEVLNAMVLTSDAIESLYNVSIPDNETRISQIKKLEDTFTTDELEFITNPENCDSKMLEYFINWLFKLPDAEKSNDYIEAIKAEYLLQKNKLF